MSSILEGLHNQMNPIHILTPCFSNIGFNIASHLRLGHYSSLSCNVYSKIMGEFNRC
jgi:hypothetical protein